MPPEASPSLVPAIALAAPLVLLLAGLVPSRWANRRPRRMARLSESAAWLATAMAVVLAVMHAHDPTRSWVGFTTPLPGEIGAFSLATYVNAVTVVMLLLVSFIGAIVTRYSRNYLDGDANHGRFHKWLSLTLAAILTLIVSGNLLLFALAWIATSLCLHQLLMFYRERPAAVLSAHKKFIASRIADASLLAAIVLIGGSLGTLEFEAIATRMSAHQGPLPASLGAAAVLVVVAAALKSAQFPLHGWLIQVMEAPTPVSALLHAGIVNAGAFLVLRMSPIMSHAELASTLLVVGGLMTLALASLVMLTQTSIKVSLAWSTVAQMGFMLLECGLGLYSLALLHIVAHSLYKAHAFLASGSGVDAFRAPLVTAARSKSESLDLARLVPALAAGFGLTLAAAWQTGVRWDIEPALVAAVVIVAVATSQLIGEVTATLGRARWLWAGALSTAVLGAYFALHALFDRLLAASVTPPPPAATQGHDVLVPLVVATFIALIVMQRLMRRTGSPLMQRVYVHLYNGLYIDVFITRFLQRVWPARARMTP